jgi:hypothetical protein
MGFSAAVAVVISITVPRRTARTVSFRRFKMEVFMSLRFATRNDRRARGMKTYILRRVRAVEPQSASKGSVLTFCTFSVGNYYFVMRCMPEGAACLAFRSLDFSFPRVL